MPAERFFYGYSCPSYFSSRKDVVGWIKNEWGRKGAGLLKIEHFPQGPSTHLGETVDLNKNLQFSEITHVCWDETGEFLFAAGNFVGSIDFGGSGIMHMDPTISQESKSRTFLARFRLENDLLFPMQLLDLGRGEPVSMVVGKKDLMKSIYPPYQYWQIQ